MIKKTFFVVLIALLLCGCGPLSVPTGDTNPSTPIGKETVWSDIASYVDGKDLQGNALSNMKGIDLIPDSESLELIVKRLRQVGEIDDNGKDSFYKAFPGIDTKVRPLTPDDAKTLRGM
jgi:hypothetical protein